MNLKHKHKCVHDCTCASRYFALQCSTLIGYVGVSINDGIQKWFVYNEKSQTKMDYWGYPYFRKPPYIYIHIRIYTITRYLRGFEPPFPPGQAPQDLPRSFLGAWKLTVW